MILHWPWFALALVLPLLVRFGLPPLRRNAVHHDGFPLLRHQTGQPLWRATLCWCALVLALCRPQWQQAPVISYQSSRDLILAVDLSASMRTPDMLDKGEQRDRLAAVRRQISALISHRAGDRIALIVFADHAYLLSPLTRETQALLTLTDELTFDLVGRTTALGEAIQLARQHREPGHPTALLLITDGRNTTGLTDPLTEAKRAAASGIRLYTLGVGADPGTFETPDQGQQDPGTELDEPLLQRLATLGQGRYFRARSQEDLDAINHSLDTLEPLARPLPVFYPRVELYPWPLALALLLILAAPLPLPRRQGSRPTRGEGGAP